jgi:hypothetical protein
MNEQKLNEKIKIYYDGIELIPAKGTFYKNGILKRIFNFIRRLLCLKK